MIPPLPRPLLRGRRAAGSVPGGKDLRAWTAARHSTTGGGDALPSNQLSQTRTSRIGPLGFKRDRNIESVALPLDCDEDPIPGVF